MTTTKEEQMRTEFEIVREEFEASYEDWKHADTKALWFWFYKACAESYQQQLADKDAELEGISGDAQSLANDLHRAEQQLAEKDVAMHHLVTAYQVAEQQLSEANARNAMLVESGNRILQSPYSKSGIEFIQAMQQLKEAISANSEAVAAWEAEKLGPLRREVAMLRDTLLSIAMDVNACTKTDWTEVLEHTQAAAEAYEREVMIKALDNFGNRAGYGSKTLLDMISELRTANK